MLLSELGAISYIRLTNSVPNRCTIQTSAGMLDYRLLNELETNDIWKDILHLQVMICGVFWSHQYSV